MDLRGVYIIQIYMLRNFLIVLLYMNNLILTRSHLTFIKEMKNSLKNEFEMLYLVLLQYILGLYIWNMDDGILIYQPKYATYLLA